MLSTYTYFKNKTLYSFIFFSDWLSKLNWLQDKLGRKRLERAPFTWVFFFLTNIWFLTKLWFRLGINSAEINESQDNVIDSIFILLWFRGKEWENQSASDSISISLSCVPGILNELCFPEGQHLNLTALLHLCIVT